IAERLCHQLILRWRSGAEPSAPTVTLSLTRPTELLAAHHKADSRQRGIERLAAEQALALKLDANRLERQVRDILQQEMGNESSAYFAAVIHDSLQSTLANDTAVRSESLLKHVVQIVDVLLAESGGTLDGTCQAQFDNLYEVLLTRVEVRAGE